MASAEVPDGDLGARAGIDAPSRRPGSDATLERLRMKILSGELRPGTVVSQTRLARELGVSTTPLREIIRQLQAEGLLEIELNRRPRVAPLDFEDLNGVYAARILMESLAISLTVPLMTDDDLAALEGDLVEMRSLAAEGDLSRWAAVHNRFHRRLVVEVPNAMAATLASFIDRAERYRQPHAMDGQPRAWGEADREHQRIVEACVAGDARGAATELANHLARTALYLSAAFATDIDPRAVRLAVGMVTCSAPPQVPQRVGRRPRRSPGSD